MVKSMKTGLGDRRPGGRNGGNCALSQAGKVAVKHGVKIVGHLQRAEPPGRRQPSALRQQPLSTSCPADLIDKESKALAIDWEDEIIKGTW